MPGVEDRDPGGATHSDRLNTQAGGCVCAVGMSRTSSVQWDHTQLLFFSQVYCGCRVR